MIKNSKKKIELKCKNNLNKTVEKNIDTRKTNI